MRKAKISIIISLLCLLTACVSKDKIPKEVKTIGGMDVSVLGMQECFEVAYSWTFLNEHTLYWDNEESQVVLDFFFSNGVPKWQIESAQQYGIDTFISKKFHNLSPQQYQIWAQDKQIKQIVVRIYIKDVLYIQDYYISSKEYYVDEEYHYQNERIVLKN